MNLSELHDMMSRMSEVGEWSVPGTSGGGATSSSSSGPAGTPAATDPHSGAGASGSESGRGGPSTQHQYQGARAVRVQVRISRFSRTDVFWHIEGFYLFKMYKL